jgi:hypothetical protein
MHLLDSGVAYPDGFSLRRPIVLDALDRKECALAGAQNLLKTGFGIPFALFDPSHFSVLVIGLVGRTALHPASEVEDSLD